MEPIDAEEEISELESQEQVETAPQEESTIIEDDKKEEEVDKMQEKETEGDAHQQARLFDQTEIAELHNYIDKNYPNSVLTQLLLVTDEPVNKATIFVIVHRMLNSCRNYAKNDSTKTKLEALLAKTNNEYLQLVPALRKYQSSSVHFGKRLLLNKIINILFEKDSMLKINELIDVFLALIEKQQLFDINRITGIDLETDSGKRLFNEVMTETGVFNE